MIVNAYMGPVVHNTNDGRVRRFSPSGPLYLYESDGKRAAQERRKENPVKLFGGTGLSARMFIGLNVGDKPTYTIEDVIAEVAKHYRGAASFVAQKGVYVHMDGKRVNEDSVQVILFASTEDEQKFTDEMTAVAEKIAAALKQESIILEIQKKGIVQNMWDVSP